LKAIHYAEVSETFAESRSPPTPLKKGGEDEKLAVYGFEFFD
jgi:hypothetical protein